MLGDTEMLRQVERLIARASDPKPLCACELKPTLRLRPQAVTLQGGRGVEDLLSETLDLKLFCLSSSMSMPP